MLEPLQESKVKQLLAKLPELEERLADPSLIQDRKQFKAVGREHAYLMRLGEAYQAWVDAMRQDHENRELLREQPGLEMEQLLREDQAILEVKIQEITREIVDLLVPPNPHDNANTILEIRAGTGGDEAALFVGDLVRMYKLYADAKGWKYELLSCTGSDMGGFKEYVMVLTGPQVYRMLQNEAGTHRVQRVPATEAQGRVHTSAATVACLMEPDEDEELVIDDKELRIDTCRSSGAGGQHVNTTDSAVRIVHIPTGIMVFCQEERSQIKNRDKAMRVLRARIREAEAQRKAQEIAAVRSSQVGTGDRSERIRTYNFSQNRLTDHRINMTLYSLDRVMNGDLDTLANALVAYFYQQQLDAVG
ncbi:MAG: peptide chain release factor 1 [Chlamydiia bacterium]